MFDHSLPRPRRRAATRRPVLMLALLVLVGLSATFAAGPTVAAAAPAGPPVGGAELADATTVVHVPAGVPQPPKVPAKGYLLADLTTGQILVAHDAHRQLLTASTMKVLTALTLLPRIDPNLFYTATRADADIDGSKVGIVAGSPYTAHQLFLGMMLSSGNDAANALANAAGGVPTTVALMQQEATSLGAYDTTVRDPSGLDAPGQRSSAYDLALIARAAMQREDFRALVATRTTTFPGSIVKGKRHKGFQIQNHNELLSHYPGAIGVKTGYTVAAKWTYIGAARRGGHTYLVTEMGLNQAGWVPATKLLDWAFAHGTQATPVGKLVTAADLAASTPSPTVRPPNGPKPLVAGATSLSGTSGRLRWVGFAGLACAAAIVAGLATTAVRRRAGP
jgi:serine-type D-Ala-D-Ala carboxypeptidase (penicillin-binding protein 5/6)